jgi:hypothetical protein
MTTMIAARTVARLHPRCPRAMMSAWSSRRSTAPQPQPPLHDSPPIVIPTSNTTLRPDTASPQTAAPPPPAPKAARPKPTIRAQKAALSLVSKQTLYQSSGPNLGARTDSPCCRASANPYE